MSDLPRYYLDAPDPGPRDVRLLGRGRPPLPPTDPLGDRLLAYLADWERRYGSPADRMAIAHDLGLAVPAMDAALDALVACGLALWVRAGHCRDVRLHPMGGQVARVLLAAARLADDCPDGVPRHIIALQAGVAARLELLLEELVARGLLARTARGWRTVELVP